MSEKTVVQATPGWTSATIEDLVEDGRSIAYGVLKPGPHVSDGVRLIKSQQVLDGRMDLSSDYRISEGLAHEFRRTCLQGGELLLNVVGSIGRSAVAPVELKGANVSRAIAVLPLQKSRVRWVQLYLSSPSAQAEMFGRKVGIAQPVLNLGQVRQVVIPLPPLDEQRRILAEIEKQFTRLDAGVAALRRVQANLERYRASVLKSACEGRLVPTEAELARAQGRTYESGAELLARILTERRTKWSGRGKHKEPAEAEREGLGPLPKGWSWSSIDQLSSHITSGSRDWSQFYGRGEGTFILAQNVRPMLLDLTERQTVDPPDGDAETDRTRVELDDVLVTIVGAKTGDVCRVPIELREHFVCQSVALLRPVRPACSKFATLYLASAENGQAQWKRYIYGQGRPHLSFEQLRMTAVPLPPLAEQLRIVAEVDRRLSVVDELEALVSANLQRATRLRQSILQRAFAGELVPHS